VARFSPIGKPLCSRCRKLATHEIHVVDCTGTFAQVFYSYQCVNHRHASSRLLTSAHIHGLDLDQKFYHRHLFAAYLASNPDMTVGCTADERLCPLAHFYSLYYEVPILVTFDGYVRTTDGACLISLPAWAKTFTLAVDFTHPQDSITGQQALALLKEVRA
jgi:hypothetical protein